MMRSAVTIADIVVLEEIALSAPSGNFVEIGVWKGGTAERLEAIAKERGCEFFAYDTFQGIPYKGEEDYHEIGDFNDTSFEEVAKALPDTHVIKGLFPASAVEMGGIAFAHIDCDQFKSITESALYLQNKMVPGGIMLFDDYGIEHLPASKKAVDTLYGERVELAKNGKAIVRF